MKISLTNTGKRYNREWIFRNFSYTFDVGKSYAITGPNGSGKSTLLQAIAGSLMVSEGTVAWYAAEKLLEADKIFPHIAIATPYLELIEEMTASEFFEFHQQFKALLPDWSIEQILARVGLQDAAEKQIRYFSSGMKQRLKLAQAFYSDVPVLLLDEPCTNLDQPGIDTYHQLIQENQKERLIIVSSNDTHEYGFCEEIIRIQDFK